MYSFSQVCYKVLALTPVKKLEYGNAEFLSILNKKRLQLVFWKINKKSVFLC